MIGYNRAESPAVFAGYRHAAVDYKTGNFLCEIASDSPILGLALTR